MRATSSVRKRRLLTEPVDADLAGGAGLRRRCRGIALAAEARARATDVVRAGRGRDRFADRELVGLGARGRVGRAGARDVAVVMEADAAGRAGVLLAVGGAVLVAEEDRAIVGDAATSDRNRARGAGAVGC